MFKTRNLSAWPINVTKSGRICVKKESSWCKGFDLELVVKEESNEM
jgi:hypothetical protein